VTESPLRDLAALAGMIFGTAGFVLGLLAYLRDRSALRVHLAWDYSIVNNALYDPHKKWGLVSVTNVGRRPVYITHVFLRLPKPHGFLVLMEGLEGTRLGEGDPPHPVVIDQTAMSAHAAHWRRLVAQVTDSTGKNWYSRRVPRTKKPSWA
jgi:hypothetical protein